MTEQECSKAIRLGLEIGLKEPISDNLVNALVRQSTQVYYDLESDRKALERLGVEIGGQP